MILTTPSVEVLVQKEGIIGVNKQIEFKHNIPLLICFMLLF